MSDLKLDSLRIQNFRTFKDLTIDRLGRVNLIVGKNNVGKTSLLEGINFYASYSSQEIANELISARGLGDFDSARSQEKSDFGISIPPKRHLIHGRPSLVNAAKGDSLDHLPEIRISSTPASNREFTFRLILPKGKLEVQPEYFIDDEVGVRSVFGERIQCVFVRPCQEGGQDFARIWDEIELTPQETQVLEALRIIEEDLEGIRFKSKAPVEQSDGADRRLAIAKVKGVDQPEPLQSLGAGMNRLFSISLTLIEATNGLLLVDEIENGLHYSVQPDLWRMIFETAQELDVQVFATTHSFDCIKAFQQAAEESEAEGRLISLRRSEREDEEGKIVAVPYDEDTLESVAHSNIEVR